MSSNLSRHRSPTQLPNKTRTQPYTPFNFQTLKSRERSLIGGGPCIQPRRKRKRVAHLLLQLLSCSPLAQPDNLPKLKSGEGITLTGRQCIFVLLNESELSVCGR